MVFFEYLAVLFIGLKLCEQIDWNWLCVTAPYWIVFVLRVVLDIKAERQGAKCPATTVKNILNSGR